MTEWEQTRRNRDAFLVAACGAILLLMGGMVGFSAGVVGAGLLLGAAFIRWV